jgi:hypothetical protein
MDETTSEKDVKKVNKVSREDQQTSSSKAQDHCDKKEAKRKEQHRIRQKRYREHLKAVKAAAEKKDQRKIYNKRY